jgi:hypothetical protein
MPLISTSFLMSCAASANHDAIDIAIFFVYRIRYSETPRRRYRVREAWPCRSCRLVERRQCSTIRWVEHSIIIWHVLIELNYRNSDSVQTSSSSSKAPGAWSTSLRIIVHQNLHKGEKKHPFHAFQILTLPLVQDWHSLPTSSAIANWGRMNRHTAQRMVSVRPFQWQVRQGLCRLCSATWRLRKECRTNRGRGTFQIFFSLFAGLYLNIGFFRHLSSLNNVSSTGVSS